jgi:hypothetical protein
VEAEVEAKLESEDAEAKERRLTVAPMGDTEDWQVLRKTQNRNTYEGHFGNLQGHRDHLFSSSRQRESQYCPSVFH